ncbi:MAG: 50S ribosomal protein L11 [Propionibacteriaceae bacterium]|nr:50S ribosomal protein L11 [Propionibacteriaceae bacterium]
MAKKKPTATIKVLATGGQANPAPPLGPVLSQHRVNIGQFISEFNSKTSDRMGVPLPVIIDVYRDGSFKFEVLTPPASYLLKKAAGLVKGANSPRHEVAGSLTQEQLKQVAKEKMADLNAGSIEAAMKVLAGTARSCGSQIVD